MRFARRSRSSLHRGADGAHRPLSFHYIEELIYAAILPLALSNELLATWRRRARDRVLLILYLGRLFEGDVDPLGDERGDELGGRVDREA